MKKHIFSLHASIKIEYTSSVLVFVNGTAPKSILQHTGD